MGDYGDFLASKALVVPSAGVTADPATLHPALKDFQRAAVAWALGKGRAALFETTGLGKTLQQLVWGQHAAERTLILAPLAVAQQTVREGERWGIPVAYARSQDRAAPRGLTITNYEMVGHFDVARFGAVVLDECFAAGTEIDTPNGRKHIEDVRIGDRIFNAAGVDSVSDVHRREVPYAIRISFLGQHITSSPNHPYFTQRGWVCAQDIQPGDSLVHTSEAVRMVRRGISASDKAGGTTESVLRSVLFSEMANEPTGARSEGTYARDSRATRREAATMVRVGQPESGSRTRADSTVESDRRPRSLREDIPHLESHEAQTFRAWGKREWFDCAATDDAGCARTDLGSGISFVVGRTDSRLSDVLQARLGESRTESRYRGGWSLAPLPESGGCEAGCDSAFARVDRLEVLEQGHPDLESLRDADGKLYFYDIGATRHPSFSVNERLVHNSSILKSQDGKTRTALIDLFRATPMRLCCTATPAPNDIDELGNHAEFLGVMTLSEMRAAFFVHDEHGYHLKGHARTPFYRWLASWALSLTRPSDLGFEDGDYDLPGLAIVPEIIDTGYLPAGRLVAVGLKGIQDRAAVRRDTLADRVQRAADLINADPAEPWIAWVGLNDEGRELAKRVGDAVLVEGGQSPDEKAAALLRFATGRVRVLITKPSIAGHGLNLQHCARMAFVGLSDSYEQYFQCIRRCYRFGQERAVRVHIVLSEVEQAIYRNVLRKEEEATEVMRELVREAAVFERAEIGRAVSARDDYMPRRAMQLPAWLTERIVA